MGWIDRPNRPNWTTVDPFPTNPPGHTPLASSQATGMEEIKRVQAELGGLPLDDQGVAEALDKAASLARFRDAFALPPGSIYLCGHSLGPMPQATPHHIEQVLTKWSHEAVLGWFQGPSPFKDAEKGVLLDDLAALVGASSATEVVAMSALTVNLHLMLAAFYRPTDGRYKIIVEEGAFPSDMVCSTGVRACLYNPSLNRTTDRS